MVIFVKTANPSARAALRSDLHRRFVAELGAKRFVAESMVNRRRLT
jgi:hypothetical protein